MVKYGCIIIDNEKVIVGSDGSCNFHKRLTTFAAKKSRNNPVGKKCYAIEINKKLYRLHRIMAKVFLNPDILIRKKDEDPTNLDHNHRIIFLNDDPFDLRLDNIQVVDQKYSLDRRKKEEDKIHLINMNGDILDTGTMDELSNKYSINRGCLRDVMLGNNKSLTCSHFKGKLIAMRVRDYTKENVEAKIQEAKNTVLGRTENNISYSDGILQIDINGNYKLRTVEGVKKEFDLKNAGGLYMALHGKRSSCCGYVWVSYKEYKKNPNIARERLTKALNHGLSSKTLKAFPDEEII